MPPFRALLSPLARPVLVLLRLSDFSSEKAHPNLAEGENKIGQGVDDSANKSQFKTEDLAGMKSLAIL